MIEHPEDSAPATLRAGELIGKFQGENDRLAQYGVPHSGLARDHAAVEPLAFGCIPLDDLATPEDFQPGLLDRLALFERHRDSHLIDTLANEGGRLQDDLRTL